MKYCPWCGQPLADPKAPFCGECGRQITAREPEEPSRSKPGSQPQREPDDPFARQWQQFEEEFSSRKQAARRTPSPTDRELKGPLIFGQEEPEEPAEEIPSGPSPTDADLEEPLIFQREKTDIPPEPASPPPAREFKLDLPQELMEDDPQPLRKKLSPKNKKKRTVVTAGRSRSPREEEPDDKARRPVSPAALILAGVLFVALVVAGIIFFHTLSTKKGQQAAADFATALAQTDLSYLEGRLAMPDTTLWEEGVLEGICQDLNSTVPQKTVENHLKTMGDSSKLGYNSQLSALTVVRSGSVLTAKYYLQIQMIPVTILTDLQDLTFQVDGRDTAAEAVEGGYTLMVPPGSNKVEAFGELSGSRQSMGSAQVDTFAAQPVTLSGFASDSSALRVELAGTETNLKVLVNGVESAITPQRGILVISPVSKGMVVTVKCDQYSQDFTVQSEQGEKVQVDLVDNPTDTQDPAQMTNRQLIEEIAPQYYTFYTSYLEATNQWDESLIKQVYEGYREELVQRMETYNAGLTFKLIDLSVDRESVKRGTMDGAMTVSFYIETTTHYQYKDKEDKQWYAGGNLQEITMRYNEDKDQWETAYTRIDDSLVLSDDLITF